jgi:hypothetical protein
MSVVQLREGGGGCDSRRVKFESRTQLQSVTVAVGKEILWGKFKPTSFDRSIYLHFIYRTKSEVIAIPPYDIGEGLNKFKDSQLPQNVWKYCRIIYVQSSVGVMLSPKSPTSSLSSPFVSRIRYAQGPNNALMIMAIQKPCCHPLSTTRTSISLACLRR